MFRAIYDSRRICGFDEDIWEDNRYEIVRQGNMAKFTQNSKLHDFLMKTGERILVEASPADRIWGIKMSVDNDKGRE